jgi:hypothetical protein
VGTRVWPASPMASDAATDSPEVEPEAIVAPLKIGIAACSSEGAALCYRTIIARSSSVMGKYRHPEIVLHSPSLGDYVDALEQGDLARIAEMMISSPSGGRRRFCHLSRQHYPRGDAFGEWQIPAALAPYR